MSYSTIAKCHSDPSMVARVTACVAQEHVRLEAPGPPETQVPPILWAVVTAADVEAAYAAALAGDNPDPGGDEAAVTDAMILAHTQAAWAP